jgi:vacuolar iron transporter family protein
MRCLKRHYTGPMSEHVQNEHNRIAFQSRLNVLRAGVLGANDGIVSIAALVVGVAAATSNLGPIIIAGVAGIVAGSLSMALGEYVSVSSQRDSETSLIDRERQELIDQPEEELLELAEIYERKGLSPKTALLVAQELTDHDAFAAHLDAELGIDERTLTNPWHAATSSALSFLAGAALPMLAIVFTPGDWRIPVTIIASLVALALTGGFGAYLGQSTILRPVIRVLVGGSLALAITWLIGHLLGGSAVL